MILRISCLLSLFLPFLVGWAPAAGPPPPAGQVPVRAGESVQNGYVGSGSCEVCHEQIYKAWRSTRHSFSVLTADEARRAGYPLPGAAAGSTVRDWSDLLFTIGGRKRIAYVDVKGQVLPISFHQRLGGWSPFPGKPMQCGPCHHTGFDPTKPNPRAPQVAGSWAELNIGCEACHGPGTRHLQTYGKLEDITVDASSRLCGTCHTLVGRALPRDDDFHATHNDVQAWNQDPHVTGTKFNSSNAFCARCHSPYDGEFFDLGRGGTTSVFAESKRNITCINCHDPHALTHAAYRREKAYLKPPQPPRSQIFKGHDGDVTTDDFFELKQPDEVCVQCHSGADRIDLDHADARCSDCHNTFRHNRAVETRVVADATHPGLSCRPCHVEADHLLTILFQDPDALRPKYIHNLTTLPGTFLAKYGFRYASRARIPQAAAVLPSLQLTARSVGARAIVTTGRKADATASTNPRPPLAPDFLQGDRHRPLGSDPEIHKRQLALIANPDSIDRYLDLAAAYVDRENGAAAADVLERALDNAPRSALASLAPQILRQRSVIAGPASPSSLGSFQSARLKALAATSQRPELGLWAQGYLDLEQQRFAEAESAFDRAARLAPANLNLRFFDALSELGQHKVDDSLKELQAIVKAHPAHAASRLALGIAYLENKQFAMAEKELHQVIRQDKRSATAPFVLAVGYLRQSSVPSAVVTLQLCLARDPDYVDAYFELARAYRLAGSPEKSIDVYRQLIARRPDHLEAHWQLANLLKYVSDATTFRLETLRSAPPEHAGPASRQALLSSLEREASKYREFALSEFAITLNLRPGYSPAIRQVAELHRRSGRLLQALELFQWLAETQPDDWLYSYRWGTTLIEVGAYQKAITPLKRAIALAPSQGDSYAALGIVYVRLGRLEEAIAMFEKAAIYQPFSPGLFTNLGAAYASRGSYDVGRKYLDRALKLGTFPLPRLYLTFTNLGLIDLREGKPQSAMKAFQNALHLAPDDSRARDLLAKTRSHINDSSAWYRGEEFVFNDMLEIFGEVTTVVFEND